MQSGKNTVQSLELSIFYRVKPVIQFTIFDIEKSKETMFGDLMGMMGKIKEAQKKVEETKKRLDTVLVEETSNDGNIHVMLTANREIKSIRINNSLLSDKEQLEDYLILTLNKAIAKASKIQETELGAVAKEGMPNIPGMDSFFK